MPINMKAVGLKFKEPRKVTSERKDISSRPFQRIKDLISEVENLKKELKFCNITCMKEEINFGLSKSSKKLKKDGLNSNQSNPKENKQRKNKNHKTKEECGQEVNHFVSSLQTNTTSSSLSTVIT